MGKKELIRETKRPGSVILLVLAWPANRPRRSRPGKKKRPVKRLEKGRRRKGRKVFHRRRGKRGPSRGEYALSAQREFVDHQEGSNTRCYRRTKLTRGEKKEGLIDRRKPGHND